MKLNEEASVAGIFFFVMILIGVSLFFIFGSPIIDKLIDSQNAYAAGGGAVTQDSKDTMNNLALMWKYIVPLGSLFVCGLWLLIVSLRERSGYV